MRILGKILVAILALWSIFLGVSSIFGIQIYFPFSISESNQVPYHRMQSIRLAVFITFFYYALLYLINATKEVYPIHFLKVFMLSLGISAFIFTLQADTSLREYVVALFFFLCGLIFHLISRPNIKKYFS